MKRIMLTIIFSSFMTTLQLQAQTKDKGITKSQIQNIENLKTKKYKTKNGKIYTAYKIKNKKQYLEIQNLIILTPIEFEALEPGELCENSNISCPEGYECKNPYFLVEDCNWLSWLFGCDSYFIKRLEKECIPVDALNNEI